MPIWRRLRPYLKIQSIICTLVGETVVAQAARRHYGFLINNDVIPPKQFLNVALWMAVNGTFES